MYKIAIFSFWILTGNQRWLSLMLIHRVFFYFISLLPLLLKIMAFLISNEISGLGEKVRTQDFILWLLYILWFDYHQICQFDGKVSWGDLRLLEAWLYADGTLGLEIE